MENQENIKVLLEKFQAGRCTPAERKQVLDFLSDPASEQRATEWMRAVWASANSEPEDVTALNRIYRVIHRKIKPARKITHGLMLRIAAAVTLLLVAGWGYLYQDLVIDFVDPVKMVSYQTGRAKQQLLQLPDGSKIWLNAMSKVSYPERFRNSRREVYLQGEAFFEVKHHPEKPFYVRSQNFYTRVLGTSFQVKAYDTTTCQVTVASGKVAVGISDSIQDGIHEREIALLFPSNRVVYHNTGHILRTDSVDAMREICWREGKLSFQHATLREVLGTLERTYDVKIKIRGDQNNASIFTADFQPGIPVRDVLETLRLTGDLDYKIDGKSVIIIPEPSR